MGALFGSFLFCRLFETGEVVCDATIVFLAEVGSAWTAASVPTVHVTGSGGGTSVIAWRDVCENAN